MCHRKPKPGEKDGTLYLHGNQATIDQEDRSGHAYVTNALTQYDIPTGEGWSEESNLAVEDAKRRVDENKK